MKQLNQQATTNDDDEGSDLRRRDREADEMIVVGALTRSRKLTLNGYRTAISVEQHVLSRQVGKKRAKHGNAFRMDD